MEVLKIEKDWCQKQKSVIPNMSIRTCHSECVILSISFRRCHSKHVIPNMSFRKCHSIHIILNLSFWTCHYKHYNFQKVMQEQEDQKDQKEDAMMMWMSWWKFHAKFQPNTTTRSAERLETIAQFFYALVFVSGFKFLRLAIIFCILKKNHNRQKHCDRQSDTFFATYFLIY